MKPQHPSYIFSGILSALGTLGLANLIIMGFTALAEQVPYMKINFNYYMEFSDSLTGFSLWEEILILVILVPIAERTLFRGIIVGELKRVISDWAAVLIGAVIFAVMHMKLIQSVYVLPAGIAFSYFMCGVNRC